MIIQIFLSGLLICVALFAGLQRTSARIIRYGLLATVAVGLVFVWAPDQSLVIARKVGIARGADLIFYTWVVLTIALLLFLYLKIVRLSRTLTALARALALRDPLSPTKRSD